MPKHKHTNFKNFSSKHIRLDTKKELEAEKPKDEEIEDEETENEETEDEAEGVSDDRRVRGQEAEEVSDEEIEGDIDSKEEKCIKERSFVWSHFEKITDDKNVIWAKCKYCR
ncbi:MAG: hypothetical protein E6K87_03965 [Thaumarchaeota archaeon]|nr:MAG: hypothetical protein E6K87_03965 [Nitrososphaerota archaeon]